MDICSYVTDFLKLLFCADLSANVFRRSIRKTRLFSIFSSDLTFIYSINRKLKLRELILANTQSLV